ncbi:uncharacterized protein V6R79_022017 [Siganus canaliculatus]
MYRTPTRPQRSPGAPRPDGRFPSPASGWRFPSVHSPYGGSGYRGRSPGPTYSPGSPVYSGSREYGGQRWRKGGDFRRPPSFSQGGPPDSPVERYFSPSMLEDPWASLRPVAAADRR